MANFPSELRPAQMALHYLLAFRRFEPSKNAPPSQLAKGAATSLTAFGDYCLRFAVLGGARIRPAHAAVRSELPGNVIMASGKASRIL
jgi:hypothetical protein